MDFVARWAVERHGWCWDSHGRVFQVNYSHELYYLGGVLRMKKRSNYLKNWQRTVGFFEQFFQTQNDFKFTLGVLSITYEFWGTGTGSKQYGMNTE